MNYNKFLLLGNRRALPLLRRCLHDRKLPGVTNAAHNYKTMTLIGTQSPRKADAQSYIPYNYKLIETWKKAVKIQTEYDDGFIHRRNNYCLCGEEEEGNCNPNNKDCVVYNRED